MASHRLRGLTWAHERGYRPLVAASSEYRRRTGVEIDWARRSLFDFGLQPLAQLIESYDLMVIDHPHVGEIAREGVLVALDEVTASDALMDLGDRTAGRPYESYRYDGHQWAVAIDAAAQVAAYRPDLLPSPPSTWSEVHELARAGLVVWPCWNVDAYGGFCTLLAHHGRPLLSPELASAPETIDVVIEQMRSLLDLLDPACLGLSPIAALDLLANEERFAYVPLVFGYSNYSRAGFARHRVRFCDMPAMGERGPTGSLLGGTGLGVSARSHDVGSATDFALWVASGAAQRGVYLAHGGQPAHLDAWNDAAADDLVGGFFSGTHATMSRAWMRPRYPGFLDLQRSLVDLTHGVLSGTLHVRTIHERLVAERDASPVLSA
jgi:multiple sugar transport system substrate-binding protein